MERSTKVWCLRTGLFFLLVSRLAIAQKLQRQRRDARLFFVQVLGVAPAQSPS